MTLVSTSATYYNVWNFHGAIECWCRQEGIRKTECYLTREVYHGPKVEILVIWRAACCLYQASLDKNSFQMQCLKTTIIYSLTLPPLCRLGRNLLFPCHVCWGCSKDYSQWKFNWVLEDGVTLMSDEWIAGVFRGSQSIYSCQQGSWNFLHDGSELHERESRSSRSLKA